eukprot:TRINITY_DN10225_c0_g1_i1.p1 TRINITY_DN10225_c0_g1~~TRINITY_DN10225_c0_g1_i1.p1  ORF type:complete len:1059 (+),score=225.48 TRINITY_DN10225_c0_g1_i1:26-3202(+)
MDPTQLLQFEQLAGQFATGVDRAAAEQALSVFGLAADRIPQLQFVLERSQRPEAQHYAAISLSKLISAYWNQFAPAQRLDIRNYALNYLATNGPRLESFVLQELSKLVSKVTKLGWHDGPEFRDIADKLGQFLSATVDYAIIGLRLLNQLVSDMNTATPGRTLSQHRKVAVSFRDQSLFRIFQISLTTLQKIEQRAVAMDVSQESRMIDAALQLANMCLSFDFIGTNPDESGEDIGTLQVPSAWRPVFEESATMQLFFDFYANCKPPQTKNALSCLVQLSSVRRSLFATEISRTKFLSQLVTGITYILRNQSAGLRDPDSYHEFCRLLARLKTNYQLTELVSLDCYRDWIELIAKFTLESFRSWQWASNSIYYLLGLWSRLVASMPYLRGDTPSLLEMYAPQVMQGWVMSRIESVRYRIQDGDEALDDDEQLVDQLDSAPTLGRCQYDVTANFLASLMDPLLAQYRDLAPMAIQDPGMQQNMDALQGQLAWLVYIIGAVVGGRLVSTAADEHELLDSELTARVLQLLQLVDARLVSLGSQQCSEALDLSLLFFFQQFRRVYIGETALQSSRVYQRLAERLNLPDELSVLSVMVQKITNNLRAWYKSPDVVGKTLSLLYELAAGYSSGKLLAKLETVNYLLHNHSAEHFPFMTVESNWRHRTTFYNTLARLLLIDESQSAFEEFMEPFNQVLAFLSQRASSQTFVDEQVRVVLIGLFRDLRGISAACANKRTYGYLFDFLYPRFFPLILAAAEAFPPSAGISVPLLKFMSEFVQNRAQRLQFDCSSPNGILLFRETSKVVCTLYGPRAMRDAQVTEVYQQQYKPIWICFQILSRALSGNYINFGVFELYGDPALNDALSLVLELATAVPLQDMVAFPKLSRAFYAMMEILFLHQTPTMMRLNTMQFLQLMTALSEGMQSIDVATSTQCCSALDHLATFYFNNRHKDIPAIAAMNQHLTQQQDLFPRMLQILLNMILFEDCPNQWSVSRPLLGMIVLNGAYFQQLEQQLTMSQPPDRREKLASAFTKLMADVAATLDARNRDRFTQNLTLFRHEVRGFIV